MQKKLLWHFCLFEPSLIENWWLYVIYVINSCFPSMIAALYNDLIAVISLPNISSHCEVYKIVPASFLTYLFFGAWVATDWLKLSFDCVEPKHVKEDDLSLYFSMRLHSSFLKDSSVSGFPFGRLLYLKIQNKTFIFRSYYLKRWM